MKRPAFFLLFLLNTGFAVSQTKTLEGTIQNLIGQGVPNMTVTLNTPTGETSTTDTEGNYHLTTKDFPTSAKEIKKPTVKLMPNPANGEATMNVPTIDGILEVYSSTGTLLDKATLKNDREVKAPKNSMAFLRYTNAQGLSVTEKLVTNKETNITAHQSHINLKSATIDTFNYQIRVQGSIDGNEIDTLLNIKGFNKEEFYHEQKDKINTKQTFITGNTISIGLNADERNYDLEDENYINNRKIGDLRFFITNEDGTIYKELVSDNNATFAITVPEKGNYFFGIKENEQTHPALMGFEANDDVNNIIVYGYDKKGSITNILKAQFGYDDPYGTGTLIPPVKARTKHWDPTAKEKGANNHLIMTRTWDYAKSEYSNDTITKAQIDTIIYIREKLDHLMNDFYKKGNTIITDDSDIIPKEEKKTQTHYYINGEGGGDFGVFEINNIIYRAYIGLSVDSWNSSTTSFQRTIYQENLSPIAIKEVQNAEEEKPTVLEAGATVYEPQDEDKRIAEWYLTRSQQLENKGTTVQGIWAPDIDGQALPAGVTNQYLKEFILNNGTAETAEEFQLYLNGEKAAQLKSGKDTYSATIGFTNKEGIWVVKKITKDNFETEDFPTFYKQELALFFKK